MGRLGRGGRAVRVVRAVEAVEAAEEVGAVAGVGARGWPGHIDVLVRPGPAIDGPIAPARPLSGVGPRGRVREDRA